MSYLMAKWDRRLCAYHAYSSDGKFLGLYESRYMLYEEANKLDVGSVLELHKTRTIVGNPTYDEFLRLISDILNPKRGGEYFSIDACTRWNKFREVYNETRDWLDSVYPNLTEKIEKIIARYLYTFCTDDSLQCINAEIQLRCQ